MISVALITFFLLLTARQSASVPAADKDERCEGWAEQGECEQNADFMMISCATSCAAASPDEELQDISSFFDLSALDIDGNEFSFDILRGKVTILTNVASYCGYTADQ
jgi:hypothetical protein